MAEATESKLYVRYIDALNQPLAAKDYTKPVDELDVNTLDVPSEAIAFEYVKNAPSLEHASIWPDVVGNMKFFLGTAAQVVSCKKAIASEDDASNAIAAIALYQKIDRLFRLNGSGLYIPISDQDMVLDRETRKIVEMPSTLYDLPELQAMIFSTFKASLA
jgi:hypothetical protein